MFWLCVVVFLLGLNIAVEGGYSFCSPRTKLPFRKNHYKDHNILSTIFCFAL